MIVIFHENVAILLVGAVGDHDSYACGFSPANSPYALITSATTRDDQDRPYSNFGDCIDINAPGDNILAPTIGPSNTEEVYLSGSSASTAVVTGVIGVILNMLHSNHTVEYDGNNIELYHTLRQLVTNDYTILLRNILLSTKHQVIALSAARDAHPNPVNYCDLIDIESIHKNSFDYLKKLKANDKTSPISRVKNNFLQHQQQKISSIYDD